MVFLICSIIFIVLSLFLFYMWKTLPLAGSKKKPIGGEEYHIPLVIGVLFLTVASVLTPIIYYTIKIIELYTDSTIPLMIFSAVILSIFGGLALKAVWIRTK